MPPPQQPRPLGKPRRSRYVVDPDALAVASERRVQSEALWAQLPRPSEDEAPQFGCHLLRAVKHKAKGNALTPVLRVVKGERRSERARAYCREEARGRARRQVKPIAMAMAKPKGKKVRKPDEALRIMGEEGISHEHQKAYLALRNLIE
jgi:hypothetical protein